MAWASKYVTTICNSLQRFHFWLKISLVTFPSSLSNAMWVDISFYASSSLLLSFSFSHSLTRSLSYSLSFSRSLTLLFSHSLTVSFSHSLILSFSHSLILSLPHSLSLSPHPLLCIVIYLDSKTFILNRVLLWPIPIFKHKNKFLGKFVLYSKDGTILLFANKSQK